MKALGGWVLAAAGVGWTVAALVGRAWTESVYCGMILVGFGLALWGERTSKALALVGGWAFSAVGFVIPYGPYFGETPFDFVEWYVLLVPGGVLVAAGGIAFGAEKGPGPRWAARAGFAGATLGSIMLVVQSDFAGFSAWTIGNALMALGFGVSTVWLPLVPGLRRAD